MLNIYVKYIEISWNFPFWFPHPRILIVRSMQISERERGKGGKREHKSTHEARLRSRVNSKTSSIVLHGGGFHYFIKRGKRRKKAKKERNIRGRRLGYRDLVEKRKEKRVKNTAPEDPISCTHSWTWNFIFRDKSFTSEISWNFIMKFHSEISFGMLSKWGAEGTCSNSVAVEHSTTEPGAL